MDFCCVIKRGSLWAQGLGYGLVGGLLLALLLPTSQLRADPPAKSRPAALRYLNPLPDPEVLPAKRQDFCQLYLASFGGRAKQVLRKVSESASLDLTQFIGATLNFSDAIPHAWVKGNQHAASQSPSSGQLEFEFMEPPKMAYAVSIQAIEHFPIAHQDVIATLVSQSQLLQLQREVGTHMVLSHPDGDAITSGIYHSNHPELIRGADQKPFVEPFYTNLARLIPARRVQKQGNTIFVDSFHTHVVGSTPVHSGQDILVADAEQKRLLKEFPGHKVVFRSHVIPLKYNGDIIVTHMRLFHGSWY